MRNEKLYLQHMIEASARIEDYAKLGKDEFFKKEMMHDYLGDLDSEVVWKIIITDLPILIDSIKKILKEKYNA